MSDKVMTAKEYREMVGKIKEVKLPSGAKFQVKRLSVMDYINEGIEDIPNEFLPFITELFTGKVDMNDEATKKNIALFEKFLKITIEKGIIQPSMVVKYDKEKKDTHLVYAELTVEDQKFLIDVITGKING
jgi:hypothetical protein